MEDRFFAYYPRSEQTVKDIWQNSTVVFDANILLNIYRMNRTGRDEFFTVLGNPVLAPRLWMPYQVFEEFLRRRIQVIQQSGNELRKGKNDMLNKIEALRTNWAERLQFHRELAQSLTSATESFRDDVKTIYQRYDGRDSDTTADHDPILDQLTSTYSTKVGERIPWDEQLEIFERAELRFKYEIPPGFKDDSKQDYRRFGDVVIWEELIRHARSASRHVIFVTEDRKRDWWQERELSGGLEPHPQLLMEFFERTSRHVQFYLYGEFVEEAQHRLGVPVSETAAEQMEILAQSSTLVDKLKARSSGRLASMLSGMLSSLGEWMNVLSLETPSACFYCREPFDNDRLFGFVIPDLGEQENGGWNMVYCHPYCSFERTTDTLTVDILQRLESRNQNLVSLAQSSGIQNDAVKELKTSLEYGFLRKIAKQRFGHAW